MRQWLRASVMTGVILLGGCNKEAATNTPPTPSTAPRPGNEPAASNGNRVVDGGTVAAIADAGAGATVPEHESTPGAGTAWKGNVDGAGAEPPIHEIVPTVVAEEWKGKGELALEVPGQDGPVSGTLKFADLSFRLRGFRTGAHVRGTLDQEGSSDVPTFEGFEDPVDRTYRGTLDAEIAEGHTLKGSWDASALAGRRRRRGVFELRSGQP